ncbi:nucleotidyltransferase domain-containing protein [bacterium]|nr:nucleotidyltransferase domain-containing protein [bacterium]
MTRKTMKFDIQKIASEIEEKCPEIIFAFLHGSAKDGTVKKGSDIDIAIYLNQKSDLDSYTKIIDIVEKNIPCAQADIGILNNADSIYRFEALK